MPKTILYKKDYIKVPKPNKRPSKIVKKSKKSKMVSKTKSHASKKTKKTTKKTKLQSSKKSQTLNHQPLDKSVTKQLGKSWSNALNNKTNLTEILSQVHVFDNISVFCFKVSRA